MTSDPDYKYVPEWSGLIENWTYKYAQSNVWRVEPHHDIDDLYQDGYLLFVKLKNKYTDVTEARHFLSLYQRSLANRINDLSKTRSGELGYKKYNTEKMFLEEKKAPKPFLDPDALFLLPKINFNPIKTPQHRETSLEYYARIFKSFQAASLL